VQEIVSVTARGHGVWGRELDVELATSTTTRVSTDGAASHVSTRYWLETSDPAVGSRSFRTEAERTSFVDAAFTGLTLTPVDPPEERTRAHPLGGLAGSKVVAVAFVQDHLQLQFDDGTLDAFVWPRLRRDGATLSRGAAGYADALVGLVRVAVTAVDELLDLGLVVDFANGARLVIPLDGTDLVGAEVVNFRGAAGFISWRPGDEDVAWLPSR